MARGHLIDGAWRAGAGPSIRVTNPSTGKPLDEIATGTADEVDAAVTSARRAFDGGWRDASGTERRKLLLRLAALVARDAADLGRITAQDMGMPAAIALGETLYAAEYLEYFAGWADKIEGRTIPVQAPKVLDYTIREPVGVVGAIVPWNAPLTLAVWKLAPALAAGNAIVIKPSELAPLAALRLGELILEAGFPPGVVQIVTGDGATTGQALVEHPGVDKISFTGGTETGRHVAATAGRMLKRVSLELGGKSANVVFADADLDAASTQAAIASFLNTGQQCIAGSRLLVEEPVHDEVARRVAAAASGFPVGDPLAPGIMIGPLISEPALRRVTAFVDEARAGATVTGGERLGGDLADGTFVSPAIVTGARNDMRVAREEIFGPVLSVIPFRDADEAIRIANDTPYGLAAGVWTRDLDRAHGVASRLEAGTVWVNAWFGVSPAVPFGGFKASGIGREGGQEALAMYTETKNVYVQLR